MRAAAPATGGSTNIARNRLAFCAAMALGLLALQVIAIRLSPVSLPVRIVLPTTLALAPVALWPLRRHLGVWVMFVGLAANLAAVLANGGLMPIERSTVIEAVGAARAEEHPAGQWIRGSKDVVVESGGGRAAALGDRIVVRLGGGGFAASPGDIVIWAGLVLLSAEASLAWQRSHARTGIRERVVVVGAEGSATTPS